MNVYFKYAASIVASYTRNAIHNNGGGEFQGLVMPRWADILRPGMTAVRRPMKQRTQVPIFSVSPPPDIHSPHYGLFHLPIVSHLLKYQTTEMEHNPPDSEANAHMGDAITLRIASFLHWLAPSMRSI